MKTFINYVKMSYFVVAGLPECCMFNHVRVIADILSERLPNFKVEIIQLESLRWQKWIQEVNLKHKWYHLSSPIIWKELSMRGGKAHLIGGASEFWEYCYDYYNLESLLSNKELYNIVADFKQYNDSRKVNEKKEIAKKEEMIICIASNHEEKIIFLLLQRLMYHKKNFAPKELSIRVSRQDFHSADFSDPTEFDTKIEIVRNLNEGLNNADLLIIIGDYTREPDEDLNHWLYRSKIEMEAIADYINDSAKSTLRVIVAISGAVCFCAAVLIENATKIHLHNIVAETSCVGLKPLGIVSQVTQIPLMNLAGPPIWGFIGLNQIIDLEHIVQKYDVYRPNLRAVKNTYGSTLELGKRHTELRYLSYMTNKFENVWTKINKKNYTQSYHINRFAKARSIVNLVKNWYFPELSGNIISLGILSNGSFDIPAGIVFSQPVILRKDKWVPMENFPVPRKDPSCIQDLIPFVFDIYKQFNLRDLH